MFYKIHYCLVAIDMSLSRKLHLQHTRTENMLAYHRHTETIIAVHFSQGQWENGIFYLKKWSSKVLLNPSAVKPVPVPGTPLQYILQCRESCPYREEPEDVNSLLCSTSAQVVIHLSPAFVEWTNCHFCKIIPSPPATESSSCWSWCSICQEEEDCK